MADIENRPPQNGFLIVAGFVVAVTLLVALLWFAWAWNNKNEREEERRQADMNAKIGQIRKEYQLQKLASNIAAVNQPPAGFIKITKDIPLREGVRIYEHKSGIRPEYVGTVQSISNTGVVVMRQQSELERSLGVGGNAPRVPDFIEFATLYDRYLAQ
jgi:hypothetical protein